MTLFVCDVYCRQTHAPPMRSVPLSMLQQTAGCTNHSIANLSVQNQRVRLENKALKGKDIPFDHCSNKQQRLFQPFSDSYSSNKKVKKNHSVDFITLLIPDFALQNSHSNILSILPISSTSTSSLLNVSYNASQIIITATNEPPEAK